MLKFLNSVHLNHLFMHLTNGLASLLSYTTLQYYVGGSGYTYTHLAVCRWLTKTCYYRKFIEHRSRRAAERQC